MGNGRKIHEWSSDSIDVSWDRRLCIHVGECTRARGDLFESGRDPWCRPDTAEADAVADVVRRCPTGALAYRRKDDGPDESAAPENTVVVSNNGPLYVRGDLEVEGAPDDMKGVRYRVALCRCGASKNKPFCDNSHEESGFRDRGAIGESGPGFEEAGGKLEIRPAKDGPLLVSGNVTLETGAGRTAWRGTKCALCRCGRSNNRPFCDGSHKTAGFRAD